MIMPSAHFFIDFAKGFLSYAVNPGPTKTGSDQSQQAPQLKTIVHHSPFFSVEILMKDICTNFLKYKSLC